jgi:hypothetical protein
LLSPEYADVTPSCAYPISHVFLSSLVLNLMLFGASKPQPLSVIAMHAYKTFVQHHLTTL